MFKKINIVIVILLCSVFSVTGQTRKELELQRKKLKKEIKQVNALLFNQKKKEKNTLEDLRGLNKKIEIRKQLIAAINSEANLLSKEIGKNQTELDVLNEKLAKLKEDYANMILKSYKSKSKQSRLMFVLSSKNFYQAYKRLEYIKQYASFRKKQGETIAEEAKVIAVLKDSLLHQKAIKTTLITTEKDQQEAIESDKKNQEVLLAKIKKKSYRYKKSLRSKINQEKRVVAKIDKIIREEIARANRAAKAKGGKKGKRNEFILSPEAKALAVSFELNKGKLPWPVKEGLVVRKFGKQAHPTFPGITINGTGLHIVTSKGSAAESIFKGKVLNVLVGSSGLKNVLIQHGNYISSYNNLENTFVKRGDVITTGQKIGRIFTDKVSQKTKLIFVLFKNTARLNPSSWILSR